jgi:hypothetical protein
MDTDAQMLQQAAGLLAQQFGGGGKSLSGQEPAMMRFLQERLGIDEVAADRVVKQVIELGLLGRPRDAMAPDTDEDEDDVAATGVAGTGPVVSMEGTATGQGVGPVITTAAPALAMGAVNSPANVGLMGGMGAGAGPAIAANEAARGDERDTDGAMAGTADANRRAAENRSGATMGQLGDTTIEPVDTERANEQG